VNVKLNEPERSELRLNFLNEREAFRVEEIRLVRLIECDSVRVLEEENNRDCVKFRLMEGREVDL
jgi:hypothetical protein